MRLPLHIRWKGLTWRCSWGSERQVRLATIQPGQNQICLMAISTFEVLVTSGEIVEEHRGWE
jgi:hypothetical protein